MGKYCIDEKNEEEKKDWERKSKNYGVGIAWQASTQTCWFVDCVYRNIWALGFFT